ncbi:elongation factor G [Streptomyces triticirhizae]|uniref:GTP-binding protein n=1 Tax=Streptomyces triticirhizae TaxID=2483353 RepID=A0A3M2LV12_9ACTN|nr:TetM/TetW/TetO/TetS family tetracycline resistance ribosomal protection protein [Streptomyces triticirhizae]RMI40946.1 GTP-binding protein [Streptomyces triticirhizae]
MRTPERVLNLGILAHVDAGKTSLTERLLFSAGVIDAVGSVDQGSTITDSLALERERGITIRSAVVSFPLGATGATVNLIDTPGHPDFIAEVERVLGVLDGAVLVVSAVEGVQAQTRVLMRTLRRLRVPTLILVNKIDRAGARDAPLLAEIAARLSPFAIALGRPEGLGTRGARYVPHAPDDPAFRERLQLTLAEHSEPLLAAYVDDVEVAPAALAAELAAQTGRALVHPVLFGSAATGAGIEELMNAIAHLLPPAEGDPEAPPSGTVFAIERGPAGERLALARMFAGTFRVRDRLPYGPPGATVEPARAKLTSLAVFERGTARPAEAAGPGRIAQLRGLPGVRVGDVVGRAPERTAGARHFAPPTLETVVVPEREAERGALHAALSQLAEQDPLINLRQDTRRREISVSLYGEVQKEVIEATLRDEFGLAVGFRETTTLHIERPVGTGEAVEFIKKDGNPFLATVGLRVEPAPVDAGVSFRLGIELGALPLAFLRAVEETVRGTLAEGLCGWPVRDCVVTLTTSGYWARQSHAHAVFDKSMSSTAGDFRGLTPLVLMDALRRAGTRVLEPWHRFRLEFPAGMAGTVVPAIARLGARPGEQLTEGVALVVGGVVPAGRVHAVERRLPELTSGEALFETEFADYRPVPGPHPPTRARTDDDPLHREEYLLTVVRHVRR